MPGAPSPHRSGLCGAWVPRGLDSKALQTALLREHGPCTRASEGPSNPLPPHRSRHPSPIRTLRTPSTSHSQGVAVNVYNQGPPPRTPVHSPTHTPLVVRLSAPSLVWPTYTHTHTHTLKAARKDVWEGGFVDLPSTAPPGQPVLLFCKEDKTELIVKQWENIVLYLYQYRSLYTQNSMISIYKYK